MRSRWNLEQRNIISNLQSRSEFRHMILSLHNPTLTNMDGHLNRLNFIWGPIPLFAKSFSFISGLHCYYCETKLLLLFVHLGLYHCCTHCPHSCTLKNNWVTSNSFYFLLNKIWTLEWFGFFFYITSNMPHIARHKVELSNFLVLNCPFPQTFNSLRPSDAYMR